MAKMHLIRDIAREKKVSIRDLSGRVGITEQGLQRIIRENTAKVETLEAIARELGVPVSIFFDDEAGTLSISGNGNTHVSGGVSGDRNQIGVHNSFDVSELHDEIRRLSNLNHKLFEENMKMSDRIVQLTEKLLKNESP